MAYSFLSDVNPQSQQWTIKARVIRFSQYLSTDQPPKVLRLDLIVVDEKGTAMDSQVPGNNLAKFTSDLKEDNIYIIRNFFVVSARALYRPVSHPYLIKFTAYTKLAEVKDTPHDFPKYAYTVTPYNELDARVGIYTYCSDIIGVLRGCTHIKAQNTSQGEKALRNICISDGNQEITIALWASQAHRFDAESYMEMATRGPLVLLFVGMTCTRYEGRVSVQGSSFCRWYHNPEIPEAATLREMCAAHVSLPTWYGPGPSQVVPQKITFPQLAAFDNPHPIYANKYIIGIKIKDVVPGQSWWYYACELCNKGINENVVNIKCTKPGCSSTSARNRYRVPLIATDPALPLQEESNTVELVLFGNLAEELIGVPVNVLIFSGGGIGAFLPKPITALFGKQFEVRVSVSPLSMSLDRIIYQVDKVLGVVSAPSLPPPTVTHQPTSQVQG